MFCWLCSSHFDSAVLKMNPAPAAAGRSRPGSNRRGPRRWGALGRRAFPLPFPTPPSPGGRGGGVRLPASFSRLPASFSHEAPGGRGGGDSLAIRGQGGACYWSASVGVENDPAPAAAGRGRPGSNHRGPRRWGALGRRAFPLPFPTPPSPGQPVRAGGRWQGVKTSHPPRSRYAGGGPGLALRRGQAPGDFVDSPACRRETREAVEGGPLSSWRGGPAAGWPPRPRWSPRSWSWSTSARASCGQGPTGGPPGTPRAWTFSTTQGPRVTGSRNPATRGVGWVGVGGGVRGGVAKKKTCNFLKTPLIGGQVLCFSSTVACICRGHPRIVREHPRTLKRRWGRVETIHISTKS